MMKKIFACILSCALCTGNLMPVFAAEVPEIAESTDTTEVEEFIEETEDKVDGNVEITEFEALSEEELFMDGESQVPFSSEEGETASLFSSGEEEAGTEGLVYEYVEETDSYKVVKGVDVDTVHIPETYDGKPVTEIAAGAFVDFEVMQSIYVEPRELTIHTGAFYNCSSLSSVGVACAYGRSICI